MNMFLGCGLLWVGLMFLTSSFAKPSACSIESSRRPAEPESLANVFITNSNRPYSLRSARQGGIALFIMCQDRERQELFLPNLGGFSRTCLRPFLTLALAGGDRCDPNRGAESAPPIFIYVYAFGRIPQRGAG